MNDREPRRRSKDIKRLQRLLNAQGKIGERKRPTSSARRGMRRWWIASRDHSGGRRNFRADSGNRPGGRSAQWKRTSRLRRKGLGGSEHVLVLHLNILLLALEVFASADNQ